MAAPALADERTDAGETVGVVEPINQQQIATLTLTFGLLIFAILATMALLRTRRAVESAEAGSRDKTMELHAEIDRLKTLLL